MDETTPLLAHAATHSETNLATQEPDVEFPALDRIETIKFDPNGDSDNPLDWPLAYKYGIVALLAFMSFTTTFTCVGIVPIAPKIIFDLEGRHSKSASVLLVTIWELGEAAGPILIGPLSEVYGRYPAYNGANVIFILATAVVALSQNSGLLIFARFLTGLATASNVLNPSIIGDIFPPEQRGAALSCVFLTTLIGGAVGPMIGGIVAQSLSWRALVAIAGCIAIACECAFFCFFRETYSPRILEHRAKEQLGCGTEEANELVKTVTGGEEENSKSAVWQAIKRPARVFFGSFVLQIMSLFGCIGFTFFYIMSTTLPDILTERYGLNEAATGSSFMTFSVGSIAGILVCNLAVDRIYKRLQKSHNGKDLPEFRLPLLIVGACLLPISIVLYGWSAELRWPLPVMLFMVIFMGFALLIGVVPLMAYVVDAFGIYSASATTAVLVARCLMGTFLPLTVPPLVEALGWGWAFVVMAAVCASVAPIPIVVMKFGARWRELSEYSKSD